MGGTVKGGVVGQVEVGWAEIKAEREGKVEGEDVRVEGVGVGGGEGEG